MTDYLTNDDGTLMIRNGDFVSGESEAQDIQRIGLSNPGEWKEWPLLGAALQRLLKSRAGKTALVKALDTHLRSDGFTRVDVTFNADQTFNVDATR